MKEKKPVTQQVAELNESQRKMLPKIFWTGIIIVLILGVLYLSQFFVFYILSENAWNSVNISVHGVNSEAFSQYVDIQQMREIVYYSSSAFLLVYAVAQWIFVKIKYPYYSDKKYFAYRKMLKSGTLPPVQMYTDMRCCGICGSKLSADSLFCSHCGSRQ